MKIEKDMPAPPAAKGAPAKYPFSTMEVGDSVFFEGATIPCRQYVAAMTLGRYKGWKFSGRNVQGGIRIWRTA